MYINRTIVHILKYIGGQVFHNVADSNHNTELLFLNRGIRDHQLLAKEEESHIVILTIMCVYSIADLRHIRRC